MEEEWGDAVGYEGRYQVSNLGRVRSVERKITLSNGRPHTCKSFVRKTHVNNAGYEMVSLKVNRVGKSELVHRMVALAFCEGYEPGLHVNHKDANRLNNRADNLEWVTCKENIRDMMRRGTFNVEAAHAVAWERRKREVAQYDVEGNLLATFNSLREAMHDTGVSESKISTVCNGHRKTAGGFVWGFVKRESEAG